MSYTGLQTVRCRSTYVTSISRAAMIVSVTSLNSIRVRTRLTVYGTMSVTHWYAGIGATSTQGVRRHV